MRNCCSAQNELLSTIFRYHNIIEIEGIETFVEKKLTESCEYYVELAIEIHSNLNGIDY